MARVRGAAPRDKQGARLQRIDGHGAAEDAQVIAITILGSPGAARVNSRLKPVVTKSGRATMVRGKAHRSWEDAAVLIVRAAARGASIKLGPVSVTVSCYWPAQHRKAPSTGLAFGDVDACLKAVLDVLTKARVIGDDSQVVELVARKGVDRHRPRIEIEVRSVEQITSSEVD